MKKSTYLAQTQAFATWMAHQLGNDSKLTHHYYRPNAADAVHFSNLADAMRQYAWPVNTTAREAGNAASSLEANTLVLDRLKTALKSADTDESMRDACVAVMQWGGVVNGNVSWLAHNTVGLNALVHDMARLLDCDDDDMKRLPTDLRFNAGMTKVYSLLVDDFIIYDSRVAAALCWFVMQWARENNLETIPDALSFPCMPAKESDHPRIRKIRNPGSGAWHFPRLNNHPRLHAQWNLRASWLLEAVLNEASSTTVFHQAAQPLRALEAALFMWGYDLGFNIDNANVSIEQGLPTEDDESALTAEEDAGLSDANPKGYKLITLGKKKPFFWHFSDEDDLIMIGAESKSPAKLSTTQMFLYLHALHDQFESAPIALANNREFKTDIALAPDGMGKTLWTLLGKELPLASRIGAILVEIGQLSWNQQQKNITFQFAAPPPSDIAALRDQLSAYAQ